MITIRNVQITDYEMASVLEDAVFKLHQEARPDYFVSQTHYSKEEFEELLARPVPISLAAVCGEQIVGICFGEITEMSENTFRKGRKIAVIEDLFTLPDYRGRGIASRLIEKAEQADALELCVWSFNASAMRLYEKLGMKVQYYRMEERLNDEQ